MAAKSHVWVSRPLFDDVIARLAAHCEVRVEPDDEPLPSATLSARLAESDAAIVGPTQRIGAAEVSAARHLRFIAKLGVGYDSLDLPALTRAGIGASNTPDVLNDSVADFAWALLLNAARRVNAADRWIRAGNWHKPVGMGDWLGHDLYGGTLGILGMGRIGRAIARRARGFEMHVIYHNRTRLEPAIEHDCAARYVDQDTLLRTADALVLVVPRTPATHHIIGAAELARMQPHAVLVNVARGGVVDEVALAEALAAQRLAGAGLDVLEGEPAVHPALLALDNVVLSPHIASATLATHRAIAAAAVDNVLAFLGFGSHAGRPPNLLNPEALRVAGNASAAAPQPPRP